MKRWLFMPLMAVMAVICFVSQPLAAEMTKKDLVIEAKEQIKQIRVDEAKALLGQEGYCFVDCREPDEFEQGHIPGALNIPRGLLEFKIEARLPERTCNIVVYCKSGGRGSLSTLALQRMGYCNAVNLDGGWLAWKEAGFEVELGPSSAKCLTKGDLVALAKARIRQVTPQQARDMIEKGQVTVIDCREPAEFAQGHVPGAENIPRGLLEFKIEQRMPDKLATIIVYCKSGGRGSLSVASIQQLGYCNAVNLDGGWLAWKDSGYPLEVSALAEPVPAAGDPSEITKETLVGKAKEQVPLIDVQEAKKRHDAGWHYFVDCREAKEFKRGHIPGALHVPRGMIEFKAADMIPEKDAKVIVYCRSGGRSCLGALSLHRMGYTQVMSMEGGWNAWNKAGYPVE